MQLKILIINNYLTFAFREKIVLLLIALYYLSVVIVAGGTINAFNKLIYPIYVILISFTFIFQYSIKDLTLEIRKINTSIMLISIFLMYSIFINYSHLNILWFLGDFAVFVGILMSIIVGNTITFFKDEERFLSFVIYFLFFIMILDPLLNFTTDINSSSDNMLLRLFSRLTIVPTFFAWQYFKNKKNIFLYLYILCLFLSIISNMRYSFITTVLVFLIFFFHYNKNDIKSYLNFKNFIYLMSFMTISIFLLINIELFQQWRFLKLFISPDVGQMSGLFEIIGGRYFEAVDTLSHINNTLNPFTLFFGNGFGAAYVVESFWQWGLFDWFDSSLISSDFRRHIIHIGPLRVFFRYGLLGIILVGKIFYDVFSFLLYEKDKSDIQFFISIVLFFMLIRFFIQPVFNDIISSLLIIIFYNLKSK